MELAREVGRLRRENEALTRQRSILKKAISIFSNDPLNGGRSDSRSHRVLASIYSAPGLLTVRQVCAALDVSESGFYAHRHKATRSRRLQDEQIVTTMKEVFEATYHGYGSSETLERAAHVWWPPFVTRVCGAPRRASAG